MAVLGSTTLTGCNSIPGFINAGTKTIFNLTAAPTSWVKMTDSNYDRRMLRVIGGSNGTSLSPGGSSVFPSIFSADKTIPSIQNTDSSSLNLQTISTEQTLTDTSSDPFGYSIDPVTLTEGQTRAHTHSYRTIQYQTLAQARSGPTQNAPNGSNVQPAVQFNSKGGSGEHTHSITETPHSHTFSHTHTHTLPPSTTHNHTIETWA